MSHSNFSWCETFSPRLTELGLLAERDFSDPNNAIAHLRLFGENLALSIIEKLELGSVFQEKQIDRLGRIGDTGRVRRHILDRLHRLRMIGNQAVHERSCSASDATAQLRNAWELATWFVAEFFPDDEVRRPAFQVPGTPTPAPGPSAPAAAPTPAPQPGLEIIDLVANEKVNYSLIRCGVPLVESVAIRNTSDELMEGVSVRVEVEPGMVTAHESWFDQLQPGETRTVEHVDLTMKMGLLARQTERSELSLTIVASVEDQPVRELHETLELLPFNYWPGNAAPPELLATFIQPREPAILALQRAAADLLEDWTDNPSLDGYQSQDVARVRKMLAAVYGAVQRLGITYTNPPASFESRGQKIRLVAEVLHGRMGTCLDLSVLAAASLEEMGLNPLVFLTGGHAFVGVWLKETHFPEPVVWSASRVLSLVELGELAVVDITAAAARPALDFDGASDSARKQLAAEPDFFVGIDVNVARLVEIYPLPTTAELDAAAAAGDAPDLPIHAPRRDRYVDAALRAEEVAREKRAKEPIERRLERWRSKLLDLSLRNRFLNYKEGRRSVSFLLNGPEELCEGLEDGRVFTLHPVGGSVEAHPPEEFLNQELTQGRIHIGLPEGELRKRLLDLARQARVTIEDGGVNTLFLAAGFLQWDAGNNKRCLAPLLLIPVRLKRQGVRSEFQLCRGEDESQINVTLLHKLQKEFGIDVGPIEALADTDGEPDAGLVIRRFREAIAREKGWRVIEQAHVSLFSFAKFVMWNDLTARAEDILANPVVSQILIPGTEPTVGLASDDESTSAHDLLCPMDADSTQVAAIQAAIAGESYVLHGPPGTGKSQTITNIISAALGEGKSVLFVSEKMAALEVVHRRLESVGLGEFCLELHSNKASKADVIAQLGAALHVSAEAGGADWPARSTKLAQRRDALDAYVHAVRQERSLGCTVFWLNSYLAGLEGAPRVPVAPKVELQAVTTELREIMRDDVDRFATAARSVGSLKDHPWFNVGRVSSEPRSTDKIKDHITELQSTLSTVLGAYARVRDLSAFPLPEQPHRGLLERFVDLAEVCVDAPAPPCEMMNVSPWSEAERRGQACIGTIRSRQANWAELENTWKPALLQGGLDEWSQRASQWGNSFFLVAFFMLWGLRKALRPLTHAGRLPATRLLSGVLERALAIRADDDALDSTDEQAKRVFGFYWEGNTSNADGLEQLLSWSARYRRARAALKGELGAETGTELLPTLDAKLVEENAGFESSMPLGAALAELANGWRHFSTKLEALEDVLDLNTQRQWSADRAVSHLDALEDTLGLWADSTQELREWGFYLSAVAALTNHGLDGLNQAVVAETLSPGDVRPAFEYAFHRWYLDELTYADDVLRDFSGAEHNRQLESFRAEDRDNLRLSAWEIRGQLVDKIPKPGEARSQGGEMSILTRELTKKRRHLPVRQLLKRIPHVVDLLKPCFLMSPLSIAQYLEPGASHFDLIVFDEASQIPCADAIGAIARGNQLIVVGDPKQLPPTNFFQKMEAGDDLDEDDFDEAESILDECQASGMMQRHLNWHYRSQHESLIAFSNDEYYNRRLHTFPAPVAPTAETGVIWRRVEDGVYDRGGKRTNKVEAQALVGELVRRLKERPRETIGVVTFSQAQQSLVEDLLEDERRRDPSIEPAFSDEREEAVFVKNLENVQGDERDVILFSICYGPDRTGEVAMNFGPLNRPGGERRLNVAVTRARKDLMVFSSMTHRQIDIRRTRARGARDLRKFLAFASGEAMEDYAHTRDASAARWPIIEDIARVVREMGYTVDTHAGMSDYRVDVAVRRPGHPESYLLGIECDGPAYHNCLYARDRDRLRGSVMERGGWSLHRIWSPEWLRSREREVEGIEDALENARQSAEDRTARETAAPIAAVYQTTNPRTSRLRTDPSLVAEIAAKYNAAPSFGESPESLPDSRRYRMVGLEAKAPLSSVSELTTRKREVRDQVLEIVNAEAPVCVDLVARRVADAWSLRRSKALLRQIRGALGGLVRSNCVQQDGEWVWLTDKPKKDFNGFRYTPVSADREREAVEIYPQEIANAALTLLKANHSLTETALYDELKKVFGFKSLGTRVRKALHQAVQPLLDSGKVVCGEDGVLRL